MDKGIALLRQPFRSVKSKGASQRVQAGKPGTDDRISASWAARILELVGRLPDRDALKPDRFLKSPNAPSFPSISDKIIRPRDR